MAEPSSDWQHTLIPLESAINRQADANLKAPFVRLWQAFLSGRVLLAVALLLLQTLVLQWSLRPLKRVINELTRVQRGERERRRGAPEQGQIRHARASLGDGDLEVGLIVGGGGPGQIQRCRCQVRPGIRKGLKRREQPRHRDRLSRARASRVVTTPVMTRGEGANGPACTPGSVRERMLRGRSSLSATRCRAAPAVYPGTRRAASASPV